MKKNWWKIMCMITLLYVLIVGFLGEVPRLKTGNLDQTIRNLYFHVPMWFGMTFLLLFSVIYAIKFLNKTHKKYSVYSVELAKVGLLFGVLGIITGMVWANFTWGEYWSGDVKQNASAIALLVYSAYFILRGSIEDQDRKDRIAAVYNIFAFALLIPLLFILPRLTDSLHPGNGGNPGFNAYDLDNSMRPVFYLSVLGWILLGWWLFKIGARIQEIKHTLLKESIQKTIKIKNNEN